MTIVLVTHEPSVAAFARRTLTFRDGRLLSDQLNPSRQDATAVLGGVADEVVA